MQNTNEPSTEPQPPQPPSYNPNPNPNPPTVVNDKEASFFNLLKATLTFPFLAIFLWTVIILRTIVATISVSLALVKLLFALVTHHAKH
jgi:hypothetical protein